MISRLTRQIILVLAFQVGFSCVCIAERTVEFTHDIQPILTKFGCNTGACHGSAAGRGGFRLSLYGSKPLQDYNSVVRELAGRRVNLVDAEASLLLLKPTEELEHGGNRLFEAESQAAEFFRQWIRQGTPFDRSLYVERLDVIPKEAVVRVEQEIELRAIAFYSDGTHSDVTRWTRFEAEDQTAVQLEPDPLQPRALINRSGRHVVLARYASHVVPLQFLAPHSSAPQNPLQSPPPTNPIDREILATLERIGIRPSSQTDDPKFLRRVSLDLRGRLPTTDEVQSFARNSDPEKRILLVDRLLASDEFTEYWTDVVASWLRVDSKGRDPQAQRTYRNWIRQQVAVDLKFDLLARQLLLSSGDSRMDGPANFYSTTNGPRDQAEFFSELFMGSRVRCANCHDHPLDRWTQDDYHGLAAIFAKVENNTLVTLRPNGEVIHPSTNEAAIPKIPGAALHLKKTWKGRNSRSG